MYMLAVLLIALQEWVMVYELTSQKTSKSLYNNIPVHVFNCVCDINTLYMYTTPISKSKINQEEEESVELHIPTYKHYL